MTENKISSFSISRNTKNFLKSIGIVGIPAANSVPFSSLEQNLFPRELEKISYELMNLGCLRHDESDTFIFDIPMGKRLQHILANYNVYYLSRLSKYSLMEIRQFHNLGDAAFQELKEICRKYNVPLPADI